MDRLCCTNRVNDVLLLTRTDLAYEFSDRYAKRGIAVKDGNADLDLSDLPVEVPRHERFTHQFQTEVVAEISDPSVKVDRMTKEVIQNDKTKEPFARV